MGLNHGLKILNRFLSANSHKLLEASLLVLSNIKLDDTALVMEVVKIFHSLSVDVIDERIVEGNEDSLEIDLFYCTLDITFILTRNGNFALVSLEVSLFNSYLDTELVLNALDLRALSSNNEANEARVYQYFLHNGVTL